MKSINLLVILALFSSLSIADEVNEVERGLGSEEIACGKPNMRCFPAATVEMWNKRIKERKNKPPVVVEKEVIKEVVKEAPKNNLSLLVGRTETGLDSGYSSPLLQAHTTGELDLGLMYQRRFADKWRASVIGTKNGSFYGGLGYDF